MSNDVWGAVCGGIAVQLAFELFRFIRNRYDRQKMTAETMRAMALIAKTGLQRKKYSSVSDLPAGTYSVTPDGKFERN
tara:strand:- start:133 stop:366 length:234 start_codon:yes stop_codon:yes gene_type:complete